MKVKDHYLTDLADLEADLERAEAECRSLAKPAHMVGNCLSDVQHRDSAYRNLRNIYSKIIELKAAQ